MTPAAVWSIVSIVLSLVLAIALIAFGIRAWNYMRRSKHESNSTAKFARDEDGVTL